MTSTKENNRNKDFITLNLKSFKISKNTLIFDFAILSNNSRTGLCVSCTKSVLTHTTLVRILSLGRHICYKCYKNIGESIKEYLACFNSFPSINVKESYKHSYNMLITMTYYVASMIKKIYNSYKQEASIKKIMIAY